MKRLVDEELLRQVLDVLEQLDDLDTETESVVIALESEITALRAALEQPAVEPVAYIHMPKYSIDGEVRPVVSFERYEDDYAADVYSERIPLFTAPQAQQPAPDTDIPDLIAGTLGVSRGTAYDLMREALEAQQPAAQCKHCTKFFSAYRCNASQGECDCPKCQGLCTCSQKTEVNQ